MVEISKGTILLSPKIIFSPLQLKAHLFINTWAFLKSSTRDVHKSIKPDFNQLLICKG